MNTLRWIATAIAFYILVALTPAHATSVTGTIMYQRQPLNGYVDIALVYPGTTGTVLDLPGADPNGHLPVYNGNFPAITVDGNDTLLPTGTYYEITFYSQYQAKLAVMNYVITGATYNLGTAVPTPITPANISFLDLLGLRNVSITNLTLKNQVQIGTGAILSSAGLSNAQFVDGIAFAQAFAATSTTCGIMEAQAALPATGGTVWLQPGLCVVTSAINITKPLIIRGMGRGGNPPINGALTSPTVIANGTQTLSLFTVSPPSGTASMSGVLLEDFAILGNAGISGATAGDCVVLNNTGTGKLSAIFLTHMFIYGCKGSGVTISGLGVGTVKVSESSISANGVNGVQVLSGAVASTLYLSESTLTNNANAAVMLADGFGHTVSDNQITPGTAQPYGVYLNTPTLSNASTVQLTLRGNNLQGAGTYDLYESATVSSLLLYAQSEQQGSSNVRYNLLAPTSVGYVYPRKFGVTMPSHFIGTVYQNTGVTPLAVTVTGAHGSSSGCTDQAFVGPAASGSPSGLGAVYAQASSTPATSAPASNAITFIVPPFWYYGVSTDFCSQIQWTESPI